MATTVYHENGDVTVSWYEHEEMNMTMFALHVVSVAVLMLVLIAPTTVWGIVGVVVLGALLGACTAAIALLVTGNTLHTETYRAHE